MYKVVIIDDEPIIVEGLSKLLPWEQYHCRIAATACNGKEGLEVIRRERPDILFSEILNCIRIRHAKEFMKEPAYRLADIAELVGFIDVTHFSRVFKKNEGISANEYRNTKL